MDKEVIFKMESNPNKGIATTSEIIIKARKQIRITNMENISCGNGFMSRNEVIAITSIFQVKIVFIGKVKTGKCYSLERGNFIQADTRVGGNANLWSIVPLF